MGVPSILRGLTSAASDYFSAERTRQREEEDKQIEYQQKLVEMQLARPDFNPAHMSKAMEDLVALSQGKTGPRKQKGGMAGFKGATETPMSQLIQGLSRGEIPAQGPTEEQVSPEGLPAMGVAGGEMDAQGLNPVPSVPMPAPPAVMGPVANQPMFLDPETMARREGRAAGIKTEEVRGAQRGADVEALRKLGMPEEIIQQVMQRQIAGGNLPEDKISGTPQKYTWEDEAGQERQGWAVVKNGMMVDASTGLQLPPNADFYEPEKNVTIDAAVSAAIRSGDTEKAAELIKAYRAMHPHAPQAARGISETAQVNFLMRMQTQWDKEAQSSRDMQRTVATMRTGLDRFAADPNGASQMILVTFQKALDETSVVRESEYARSADGISKIEAVRGKIERYLKGGAGVPRAALAELVASAEALLKNIEGSSVGFRARTSRTAARYGIPEDLIFTDDPRTPGVGIGIPTGGVSDDDVQAFMQDFGVDEATARRTLGTVR
jgi:hypothetical protein